MRLFKSKKNGVALPGDIDVCGHCTNYDGEGNCLQNEYLQKLDFDKEWKYSCNYFVMDTSSTDKVDVEHQIITRCVKDTLDNFQKCFTDEEDAVIFHLPE